MARIPTNGESPRRDYGYSLKLTNWFLESGETCHMTTDISNFIPGSLVKTDKYIEFSYGNFVIAGETEEVQIKCVTKIANPSLLYVI